MLSTGYSNREGVVMQIELGLEKIRKLLFLLGNPEKYLKVIHVAGTNGKGSVIAYIYSILMKKGLKVGRYCSPAVFEELEIIQINGVNIPKDEYDTLMEEIDAAAFKMNKEPSQFEKETALAIMYFERQKCDVCIFETGMGGSLDATNVFRKTLCSVITTIDYDHMGYLGDSIEEIAVAKAGIIKNYCRAVMAPQKYPSVFSVIKEKADKSYAPLVCVNKNATFFEDDTNEDMEKAFSYKALNGKIIHGLKPKNQALYQRENISTAIEVINVLNYYEYGITDEDIVSGINATYWPGRFEKVCDTPLVYMDGAHNPNGAVALKETIEYRLKDKKLTFVMGIFKDKDYKQVVKVMTPMADKVYTFTPVNERGLSCEVLREEILPFNSEVYACESLDDALDRAISGVVYEEEAIIVFGSLSYLKDVKKYFEDCVNEDRK